MTREERKEKEEEGEGQVVTIQSINQSISCISGMRWKNGR